MKRLLSCRRVVPVLLCALLTGPFFTTGCTSVTGDEPPIADSTFARVLVELHLLDGRRQQGLALPTAVEDTVFAHYGVTRTAVEHTLKHYSTHPKSFAALYNAVLDTLRAIEQHLPAPPSSKSSP